MTKNTTLAETKKAGILLRAAISVQLRKDGPQTAAQVHNVIGGDYETVRTSMYRMVKAGVAKSVRGTDAGRNSIFRIAEQATITRNVGQPFRPVVKEWKPNLSRDPLALPAEFFGARP